MTIETLYKLFLSSGGVSTDTRKIKSGNIFFALKGPNFNGNKYAKGALEAGAKYAVVDEKEFAVTDKYILVNDTLATLQQLAAHHRQQLRIPFIAITGSNGKTTTKELISAVLSTTYKTFFTQGNLNNHIGVPLTLLSISKDTEMAVIEIGANHIGENAFLCEIVNPDLGIVTNNGKDHLEGYGSLAGVRKGNGEMFEYMKKKKGVVFVPASQEDLMSDSNGLNKIIFGDHDKAFVKGKITNQFPSISVDIQFGDSESTSVNTHLFGKYNLDNILASAAIGYYFKVPVQKIAKAISDYLPANNRSQLVSKNGNTFFLDAYNANPSSMTLALENFAEWSVKNKIIVLGEMLELGDYSLKEHRLILSMAKQAGFEEIVLVGEEFRKAIEGKNNHLHYFSSVTDLKKWFDLKKFSGYHFLLKGSRLNKLEKLLED